MTFAKKHPNHLSLYIAGKLQELFLSIFFLLIKLSTNSAGIGRTGVLILMETGICLIEANQPVYPLELVRIMRNQRAMLIQTSTQFRFVCEALHRVFRDHIVRPLDQYKIADSDMVTKKDADGDETKPLS